jgi:integrase
MHYENACFESLKNGSTTLNKSVMNHHKFSVLFWIKKDKVNAQGLAPIWARITVNGRRSEFSTQQQIPAQHWNAEAGVVSKQYDKQGFINDHLLMIKAELMRHYNALAMTQEVVTAEEVRDNFKGVKKQRKTLLQLFTQFIQQLSERHEIDDLSEGRLKRFKVLEGKCRTFVKIKLKRTDIELDELKLNFIVEFEHYLRTVDKIGHNTAMKYAKDLKQVISYAVTLDYIPVNVFLQFNCSTKKVRREFLDQDELTRLYRTEFKMKRLEEVRDCYLFSCYTGYAYSDAAALTPSDVTTGIDSEKWITRNRIKTDTPENVPLLPIPLEIIEKYRKHAYCKAANRLLPMNSNQRYNAYLKEITDLCGIKKKLTTHTARHTFATTVLLTNDVPMETVMELLGHTDIRTTQIYGKIVQKKVSTDIRRLKETLRLRKDKSVRR